MPTPTELAQPHLDRIDRDLAATRAWREETETFLAQPTASQRRVLAVVRGGDQHPNVFACRCWADHDQPDGSGRSCSRDACHRSGLCDAHQAEIVTGDQTVTLASVHPLPVVRPTLSLDIIAAARNTRQAA